MFKRVKLILNRQLLYRIFFTLFIANVFIFGRRISIPFLNPSIKQRIDFYKKMSEMDIFKPFINFNFDSLNLLSLSIYPYITVSIFMQLAQKFVPTLKEWREQGESGKHKINRLTRFLALVMSMLQSYLMINSKFNVDNSLKFIEIIRMCFFLTAGTAISIWLADLITAKGIGNGSSILIMIGLSKGVSDTFTKIFSFWSLDKFKFFSLLFFLLFILICTIIIYLATLKIKIIYPNKKGQVENYIPLKINSAGVLPIILVSTLQAFFLFFIENISFMKKHINVNKVKLFISMSNLFGLIFFVCMIIIFSFLISFLIVNPNDITEHLSKQDAYIANYRPGQQTMNKISHDLFRITIFGIIFMILLFILPYLISSLFSFNEFKIGGTGFLIIVGVSIETLQQMNSTVNKEHYERIF